MAEVKIVTATDIELPEDMVAEQYAMWIKDSNGLREALAAALAWLANNPVQFTDEEFLEMSLKGSAYSSDYHRKFANELQRRLFLRREPALPDEVKAMLWKAIVPEAARVHNEDVAKAYALGKAVGAGVKA